MTKVTIKKRSIAGGKFRYDVNPSRTMREKINVAGRSFVSEREAEQYASDCQTSFEAYQRRMRDPAYADSGTVNSLIVAYKGTNNWNKLSDNTKSTYNFLLDKVVHLPVGPHQAPLYTMQVTSVKVQQAERIYKMICDDTSPITASHCIKVLRRIWFIGQRLGLVRVNPFQKMGIPNNPDREVLWEPQHVMQSIDAADAIGMPSIGTLALLCYDLCQRPGDMRQLRWSNLTSRNTFDFVQEKTGVRVEIPLSPRLVQRLKSTKHHDDHDFICWYEKTGKPYDRFLYQKKFAEVRQVADIPVELQLRDLRRTGATEMAEAGCTEDELRSVTGHQSRDVLSIYVRPTKTLAQAGISKRFANATL